MSSPTTVVSKEDLKKTVSTDFFKVGTFIKEDQQAYRANNAGSLIPKVGSTKEEQLLTAPVCRGCGHD